MLLPNNVSANTAVIVTIQDSIGQTATENVTLVSNAPREARHKAGVALGVILAAGVVATVIAVSVVYGTPTPPPQFGTVQNP